MNTNINNINFSGKIEILYGLDKAANMAKRIEYNRTAYTGPHTLNTKHEERLVYNATMRAYLDMATKDIGFLGVVKEITQKEVQEIKNILTQIQTQHGTLKPFDVFKDALNDVIKHNRGGAKTKKDAADELLKLLA